MKTGRSANSSRNSEFGSHWKIGDSWESKAGRLEERNSRKSLPSRERIRSSDDFENWSPRLVTCYIFLNNVSKKIIDEIDQYSVKLQNLLVSRGKGAQSPLDR